MAETPASESPATESSVADSLTTGVAADTAQTAVGPAMPPPSSSSHKAQLAERELIRETRGEASLPPETPSGASIDSPDFDPSEAYQPDVGLGDPTAPAVSSVETSSRWLAIGVGAGGATMLVAGVLATLALRGGDSEASAPDEPAPVTVTTMKPAIESPETESITTESSANDALATSSETAEEVVVKRVEASLDASNALPPVEIPAAEVTRGESLVGEPIKAVVSPRVVSLPRESDPPAAATRTAPSAAPVPFDPLAHDPAELDLVLRRGPTSAPPAEKKPDNESPSGEKLGPGLDRIFAVRRLDEGLVERADLNRAVVRRGATGPPAVRLSAERLMSIVTPEIELGETPLWEMAEFYTELSAAPITIDPAALRRAGVDAKRLVKTEGTEATLGDTLGEALRQARLGFELRGPHVMVSRLGSTERSQTEHDLSDLLSPEGASLDELVERIALAEAPASAHVQVTDGSVAIDAPRRTHYDLLVFCERLRLARGLPMTSRYPRKLLRVEPTLASLTATLDRRTTFTFIADTRLLEVVQHWRRAAGLVILVDWASLGDASFWPETTIACAVENKPWSVALDAVLGPLGLAWTVVDGETILITTRETAQAAETIEFYPLPTLARTTGEAFAADLAEAEPNATVVYDGASRSAIVRANTATHRRVFARYASLRGGE
ncbi:hypothetical protein Mal64_31720 [Pseudobythopirellula maris]|uniref:Uncharacterized protein n=2 Tax=Pseudobythopirellula maris TaxID=2527991 RepID=A0A5C5ZK83_9BACT|nr:hypothetical protein Mal64_31720 [Pseudobythopirellula maris]